MFFHNSLELLSTQLPGPPMTPPRKTQHMAIVSWAQLKRIVRNTLLFVLFTTMLKRQLATTRDCTSAIVMPTPLRHHRLWQPHHNSPTPPEDTQTFTARTIPHIHKQDIEVIFSNTVHEHQDFNPVEPTRVVIFTIICLLAVSPFLLWPITPRLLSFKDFLGNILLLCVNILTLCGWVARQ